jgi:taurine dioxygenase
MFPVMTPYKRITVRPISGTIGAELDGVDSSGDLDQTAVEEIRQALLEFNVVFLRDQELTSEQYLAFASRFGEPSEYPMLAGLPGFPVITPVIKHADETVNFGGVWHTDTTYLQEPPSATLLLAREVPPRGGDTLFANLYAAFDGLSGGMQRLIGGLTAISSSGKTDAARTREDRVADSADPRADDEYVSEHPVVRTHPETGRKALYVNVAHTVRFAGMTEEESAPLLGYLYEHSIRPEFTCRFSWRVGSLAIWDNRCSLHNPVNDYHGYQRVMHRITLRGDRPR